MRWILVTPREQAVARAAREIRAGLSPVELLGAVFVAAVREISPSISRFNHSALCVSSIDQLTSSVPEHERLAPALWCLDSFKAAQTVDARDGDWKLGAVDEARVPAPEKARAALVEALERWDPDAADPAVVGFVRSVPLDDAFELLWEYGTRCQANIGHKAIYAAMAHRALALSGPRFAEDALRSLVASFFIDGRGPNAEPFEESRALVDHGLVLRAGAFDAGLARETHKELARATPKAAQDAVAAAVRAGGDASSIWDGLVAIASEIVVARPSIGPLHAMTSLNALHYIQRAARTERVRTLALLQAAAWMSRFRERARDEQTGAEIPRIEPSTADRAIVGEDLALVRRRADDVHEFKFAAATAEEIALAGSYGRGYALAALPVHLPPPDRPTSEALARIREAVAIIDAH